jgi:hypothetical protein
MKYTLDDLLHEHEEEEQKRLDQREKEKIFNETQKEIEMIEKNSESVSGDLFEGQQQLEQVNKNSLKLLSLSVIRVFVCEENEVIDK